MSLSDCPECWETPCCCGYKYRKYSKENFIEFITDILSYKSKDEAIDILIKAEKNINSRKINEPPRKERETPKVESKEEPIVMYKDIEEAKKALNESKKDFRAAVFKRWKRIS